MALEAQGFTRMKVAPPVDTVAPDHQAHLILEVFRHSPAGIVAFESVRDDAGRVVDFRWILANAAAERINRRSRAEMLGQTLLSLLPGVRETGILSLFQRVVESGSPESYEHQYDEDGVDGWFHVDVSRMGDGLLVIFQDITPRKRAELRAREIAERFQAVIEATPDGICISDLSGQILEANSSACELLRYKKEELLRLTLKALDDRSRVDDVVADRALFQGLIESGEAIRIERIHRRKDGSTYVAEIDLRAMDYLGNKAILGVFRDVTERKRSEEQLRLQAAALVAAANAIVIADKDANIIWVNPAFTELTGYSERDVVGLNPRFPESNIRDRTFQGERWRSLQRGVRWQGSFVNQTKDGREYPEDATITPVRNGAGTTSHYIAIKDDATEKKQLADQLRRAQRLESVGLLAGGIAHDLNNLLTPILMSVELIKLSLPEDPDLSELAELSDTIMASAQRAAGIIGQVLTFARGSGGDRGPIQIRHVLKEVLHIVDETFPRSITVHRKVAIDLWPVNGEANQLHQVFLNLVLNARDAMPQVGSLIVEASNRELRESRASLNLEVPAGPYVEISVRDTGVGIPPEDVERVFEPFFTTKEEGRGTGLGLPTALGIIKGHEGLIEVETELGGGSTFRILLPAHPSEYEETRVDGFEPLEDGANVSILVVDDEPQILKVASYALTRRGYLVETAADGQRALEILREHPGRFRAVLTDVMMPKMDGVELVRSIRSEAPETAVVACSGWLSSQDAEDERITALRGLGVTTFLQKPFSVRVLIETLDQLLRSEEHRPRS